MELFDEDTFSTDLLNVGAEQVKKEGGFSSSLEKDISDGLINALSTLISDSGIFNRIVDNMTAGEKEKIGAVLKEIAGDMGNNIKSEKIYEEINTLLNNENIEVEDIEEEVSEYNSVYSEKLKKIMDIIINYMDSNEKDRKNENISTLKNSKTEKENPHNM